MQIVYVYTFIHPPHVTHTNTQAMNQSLGKLRSDAHADSQVNGVTPFSIKCVCQCFATKAYSVQVLSQVTGIGLSILLCLVCLVNINAKSV